MIPRGGSSDGTARPSGRPMKRTSEHRGNVAIAGAGLAGSLLAIYLGRRGFEVDVYERRADPRTLAEEASGNRSINLGLSTRGIRALTDAGVIDRVMEGAVPARGRVIHGADGSLTYQPYGKDDREILHSISRRELNIALIDEAERAPGVRFHYGTRCTAIDRDTGRMRLRGEDGRDVVARAEVIVGADGAFSRVRQQMQRGERAAFQQEFMDWGYKELTLPAGADGASQIELNALHIWPRGGSLIVTHPNADGSHTCTLFLPFEGEESFATLRTDADVMRFFRTRFADLPPLMPALAEEWARNPTASLVTTRTAPWHYRGRVVLVGDACHAVYPFYGQGMNAALEDCTVLDACIARGNGDWQAVFAEYQSLRKRHTDALAELAKENFDELRDRVKSRSFVAQKKANIVLNRIFPTGWIPLYTMIVHTTIPYADARARAARQERILRWTGLGALAAGVLAVVEGTRGLLRRLAPRRTERLQVQAGK
jgi:kynurenine 3-monooxygenase